MLALQSALYSVRMSGRALQAGLARQPGDIAVDLCLQPSAVTVKKAQVRDSGMPLMAGQRCLQRP